MRLVECLAHRFKDTFVISFQRRLVFLRAPDEQVYFLYFCISTIAAIAAGASASCHKAACHQPRHYKSKHSFFLHLTFPPHVNIISLSVNNYMEKHFIYLC